MSVAEKNAVAPALEGVRRRRSSRWMGRRRLPYLLILPAVLFELLIHVIPLLSGIGISFLGLSQFFIRNWTAAPVVGFDNYSIALKVGEPVGRGLLHSFLITAGFTTLVIGLAWSMGLTAALLVNSEFRGR